MEGCSPVKMTYRILQVLPGDIGGSCRGTTDFTWSGGISHARTAKCSEFGSSSNGLGAMALLNQERSGQNAHKQPQKS